MIESLKKTMLAGLGAAVVTRDKIVDSLDDLVKQGKISASDARGTAEKIAGEARRDFDKASTKLGEKVREFVSYADGEHAKRLAELEARVAAMEAKHAKSAKPRAKS
jgi:polyhydroxyalkanoate synthesis regulator phasin